MLRYFFDEHVKEAIADQLKLRGIDVLTAKDAERANQEISDEDQLAFAAPQGRVLVTADRDFTVLAYARTPHEGVILLQREVEIGQYVEYLEAVSLIVEPEEIRDQLVYYDW
jgi:predicted nuclease of predicted toxin-antitoxin system